MRIQNLSKNLKYKIEKLFKEESNRIESFFVSTIIWIELKNNYSTLYVVVLFD